VTRFTRITISALNSKAGNIVPRLLSLVPFRGWPSGEVSGAPAEFSQYTFRANRLYSPLTWRVSRTIVDTAVRVESDLEAGSSALPKK
jgi:hypothetical protein